MNKPNEKCVFTISKKRQFIALAYVNKVATK